MTRSHISFMKIVRYLALCVVVTLFLAACGTEDEVPTPMAEAETAVAAATSVSQPPPTWTPPPVPDTPTAAPTQPPPPTSTPQPTATLPPPTATPTPTATATPTETATPAPVSQPPAQPTLPPDPVLGANLLPNGSFEEGHYNQNGVPELQLPNGWGFSWDEGPTGYGTESWDVWVRPETRVLSRAFLPESEHSLYIYDGNHTVKAFKGNGAISFRMTRDVTLEPGTYVFEINVFPDLVIGYDGQNKIWADDPAAGEVRLIVGNGGTGWLRPVFGRRNTFEHVFSIDQPQTLRVGAAIRGRYAIPNNGWFLDHWTLKQVQ